jgi:hypothetical protein
MSRLSSRENSAARLASIALRKILTGHAEAQAQSERTLDATRQGRSIRGIACVAGLCLLLGFGGVAHTQTVSQKPNPIKEGKVMTFHASGPFDVKMIPHKADNKEAESANIGRMSGDKQFHGDLEATGKGEMLSVQTAVEGSAAYVALELVSGKLQGRSGTFVLQHSSTMGHGEYHQSITVVPDSGTGQLVGLAGKMTIIITDGKHFYEFDYTLPETP